MTFHRRRMLGAIQPKQAGITNSQAFINWQGRTSLDGTHTTAYQGLLNGMTTDGLFNSDGTSSFFDFIFIYATQNATTALLSIVNATYSGTNTGGLGFTTDRGYTGISGGSGTWIDSGFNPTTATSPKYTQNSAHFSAWSLTNAALSELLLSDSTLAGGQNIYPKYTDNNVYQRINESGGESGGFLVSTPTGLHLANRDSSTGREGYLNATSIGTYGSVPSSPPNNGTIVAVPGSGIQCAMMSAGINMTPTQITNFYNDLRTYMTAVGVP